MSVRMFIPILTAVLLCLSGWQNPATAATRGKIVGRITDDKGSPLPGANVVVVGTRQGAIADPDGYYVILLVEPGAYRLEASLIGYRKVAKEGVKVVVDYTSKVDFQLTEAPLEAQEVVVQAERPLVEHDKTASKKPF